MEKITCTLTATPTLKASLTGIPTLHASIREAKAIVKTDELSVTENGTYNAREGYGYTRVTVDVPIPSNYGLITYDGSIITVS